MSYFWTFGLSAVLILTFVSLLLCVIARVSQEREVCMDADVTVQEILETGTPIPNPYNPRGTTCWVAKCQKMVKDIDSGDVVKVVAGYWLSVQGVLPGKEGVYLVGSIKNICAEDLGGWDKCIKFFSDTDSPLTTYEQVPEYKL